MKSSSAKTLGVVLVVLAVLLAVGLLRTLVLIPLGVVDGLGHGLRSLTFHRGAWFWPWAGLSGLFGLLFLVFWIWVVVWVYRDAEKRGMEGVLWAILVFFTHLIGLLIFALVRSGKPVKPAGPAPPPAEAKPAAPAPAVEAVVVAPVRPASCSRCGKDVQADWRVCPFCGEKI